MPIDVKELNKQVEKLSKSIKELSNLQSRTAAAPDRKLAQLEQEVALRQQIYEFTQIEAEKEGTIEQAQKAELARLERKYSIARQTGTATEEQLNVQQQTLDVLQGLVKASDKVKKELGKQVQEAVNLRDNQQAINREFAKGLDHVKSLTSEFLRLSGVGKDFNDTVLGKMTGSLTFIVTQFGEILKRVGDWKFSMSGLAESPLLNRLAGAASTFTKELFFSQDRLRAEFYSSTGALSGFGKEVDSVADSARRAALGMESWYKVAPILTTNMASFRTGTSASRRALLDFAGGLEEMGGHAQSGSRVLGILTDSMGRSATSAMSTTRALMDMAAALKVNVGEAMNDWVAAAPIATMWGTRFEDVMKKLQVQSGLTGISMQRLVQIADQFSSFERAADMSGKLNAILGQTIFSSIDMIFMSHEKRIEHIHGMLRQVGITWAELGDYQKRALATTMQMSTAEASQFFTRSLDEQTLATKRAEAAQRSWQQLILQTQSLLVRWGNALKTIAMDLGPFAEKLGSIISSMAKFLSLGNGWVGMGTIFAVATFKMVSAIAALNMALVATGTGLSTATMRARTFLGAMGRVTAIGGGGALALGGSPIAGGALMGAGIGSFIPGGTIPGAIIGAGVGALTSFQRGGSIPVDTTMVNTRTGKAYARSHAGETIVPRGGGGPSASELASAFESAVRRVKAEEPAPQPVHIAVQMDGINFGSAFTALHRKEHSGLS